MPLDLSSLESSAGALARALRVVSDPARGPTFDADTQEALKAGVIQSFEVCYDQCWKMMKRWLERNQGSNDVDGVTRRQLFRLAVQAGLIADVDEWMLFHHARNETSHSHNCLIAQAVLDMAPRLSAEAGRLLEQLKARNAVDD